ncbi:IMP dehydrogenase [Candidatus Gottesmanbacteria bacterium]|nr:IMP dehydrogenase [Candidatus Gottesmanbacteria bacterium]
MDNSKILDQVGLTFDDILVLPNYTETKRQDIDLTARLTKKITLKIPILSSPMDTVTTSTMAIALGNLGGMGIIHRNFTIEKQAQEIVLVKQANVRVGAALGVGKDLEERAKALIQAETDILVLDSAHGFSKWIIEAIKYLKSTYPDIELIAGNIATAAGAKALIEAGADSLRVGMGPGSICTTRVISGMGVPQITAIIEAYSVAKQFDIPVIGDGGIKFSGDVVKAIAAGADTVMLGSLLAGADESPGEKVTLRGKHYKKYRGMGSVAAMKEGGAARYGQEYVKGKEKKLIAEGVEGLVPYSGKLEDVVNQLIGGLRTGMYYTGVKNIEELKTKTRLMKITQSSLTESHPHDILLKEDS